MNRLYIWFIEQEDCDLAEVEEEGFYAAFGLPGNLYDSDFFGPFSSEIEAYAGMREMFDNDPEEPPWPHPYHEYPLEAYRPLYGADGKPTGKLGFTWIGYDDKPILRVSDRYAAGWEPHPEYPGLVRVWNEYGTFIFRDQLIKDLERYGV